MAEEDALFNDFNFLMEEAQNSGTTMDSLEGNTPEKKVETPPKDVLKEELQDLMGAEAGAQHLAKYTKNEIIDLFFNIC